MPWVSIHGNSKESPSLIIISAKVQNLENYFDLAHHIMNALWVKNVDIDNENVLSGILIDMSLDSKKIISFAKSNECKKIMDEYTELGIKKNIFGAPTFIIEDQIYWGQDRLDFVERHLINLS